MTVSQLPAQRNGDEKSDKVAVVRMDGIVEKINGPDDVGCIRQGRDTQS